MNRTIGTATVILIVTLFVSAGTLLSLDVVSFGNESSALTIEVDQNEGTNVYTMVEIDEGDNDEEESVVYVYHVFSFTAMGGGDTISWDFGDGTTGVGSEIDHQFEEPGVYTITSTSITSEDVYTSSIEVLVHLEASAEVDNMECACAPTGKDTTVDLLALPGTMSIEGYLTVEHDGSSESCSQRNPLQECHLRVILERTESGEVVSQDVLYDSTFRTNEVVIDFNLQDMTFEQGDG
ncbi:MAG: PKD domain-containing protein, partial [Candidatus Poseidoniales archaeon]